MRFPSPTPPATGSLAGLRAACGRRPRDRGPQSGTTARNGQIWLGLSKWLVSLQI